VIRHSRPRITAWNADTMRALAATQVRVARHRTPGSRLGPVGGTAGGRISGGGTGLMSGGGSSMGSGGRGNGGGSCRGSGGSGFEACLIMSKALRNIAAAPLTECRVHVSAAADRVCWWASQTAAATNPSIAPPTPNRSHHIGTQWLCGLPLRAHGMHRRACGSVDIPIAGAHTVANEPRPLRRHSCVR
jgi:hypothetical protein